MESAINGEVFLSNLNEQLDDLEKNWSGVEEWLASAVVEVNKHYVELRNDLSQNTGSWTDSQRCERIASHRFHLSSFLNQLFRQNTLDLASVQKSWEECLKQLITIPGGKNSEVVKQFKDEAKTSRTLAKEMYEQKLEKRSENLSTTRHRLQYIKQSVVLGDLSKGYALTEEKLSYFEWEREFLRKQIQNIHLLRIICTLENELTKERDALTSAVQSGHLSRAYLICEKFALSKKYEKAAEKRFSHTFSETEEVTQVDKKLRIREIVKEELELRKANLEHIKIAVETAWLMPLSSIDSSYIEQKYIKYCLSNFSQEAIVTRQDLTGHKALENVRCIYDFLMIDALTQVPYPLNQLEYYKLLMQVHVLINKEDEKRLVTKLKLECSEQVLAFNVIAKQELNFMDAFADFLDSMDSCESITVDLDLNRFCGHNMKFQELHGKLTNLSPSVDGEKFRRLQKEAENFPTEQEFFLIDKLIALIHLYIKPVEITQVHEDGREIIVVQGRNISISKFISQVEEKLRQEGSAQEVRFVASGFVCLDQSLSNEKGWNGKNIVIFTKTVKVTGSVTINVSGKDRAHTFSSNAGTDQDGHGRDGMDGYAGESGGNVLILAEHMENAESLTIVSNGGAGSRGQDGGHGRDGKDGTSIKEDEFVKKFPPVAKTGRIQAIEAHEKTISSINECCNSSFEVNTGSMNDGHIYMRGTTATGNKITFSSYMDQAIFLYKGSLGQAGGRGGSYGLGGRGGFAGDISVVNLQDGNLPFPLVKTNRSGDDGPNGSGGSHGKHGRNGWDLGYVDWSMWKSHYFFGKDYNSNLVIRQGKGGYHVWCEYSREYVEFGTYRLEHPTNSQFEQQQTSKQNHQLAHHAQASRKKNIAQSTIFSNYSQHVYFAEKSQLQNLQADLQRMEQQALETAATNRVQEEQREELEIRKQVKFSNHAKIKTERSKTLAGAPVIDTDRETNSKNVNRLIEELSTGNLPLDHWLQLKNVDLSYTELNLLLPVFKSSNKLYKYNHRLHELEDLLATKYKFATLHEIEKQLPSSLDADDSKSETETEIAPRYLYEVTDRSSGIGSNISHPTLGTLDQYFFKNREGQRSNISKFCEEALKDSKTGNYERVLRSVQAFVELGQLQGAHPTIQKVYEAKEAFAEKRDQSVNACVDKLVRDMAGKMQKELGRQVANAGVKTEETETEIQTKETQESQTEEADKDTYKSLEKEFIREFDWDACVKDTMFLEQFLNHMKTYGPISQICRGLLAEVFDVNIRTYIEDESDTLALYESKFSSAEKTLHILYRSGDFVPLKVNETFLRLDKARRRKNRLYANILQGVSTLRNVEELEEYLKSKTFLNLRDVPEAPSPVKVKRISEDEALSKIEDSFSTLLAPDKKQMLSSLEKLKSQYIGDQEILCCISERFSSEGRHVSFEQLMYIASAVLASVVDDRDYELSLFHWIISANPQRRWMDEVLLIELENHFKAPLENKAKWQEYLEKITSKQMLSLLRDKLSHASISVDVIEETFRLLSNISSDVGHLEQLDLTEWPYALKEEYWVSQLRQIAGWPKESRLQVASYYLLSMENNFGTVLVETFISQIKAKESTPDQLHRVLLKFYSETWNLSQECINSLASSPALSSWIEEMETRFSDDGKDRDVGRLVELIQGNGNTSNGILDQLPKIKESIIRLPTHKVSCISEVAMTTVPKSVDAFTENDIKKWAQALREHLPSSTIPKEQYQEEMLAVIDKAIELKRKFRLRHTQKLSILALLQNKQSTLAQVSTGEGKTLIVVAASIMKGLRREQVDIITSSSVLAKRDAEENVDLYDLFSIGVSHNSSEDVETRKKAYSNNQVVYGDLSSFQRDYLLDRFYGRNVLGDRNFQNLIVDEVDSMLLDKGNNILYLSHELAGLDKLESTYIFIWQWINRPNRSEEALSLEAEVEEIKGAVLKDFHGLITKQDIQSLHPETLDMDKVKLKWDSLVNHGVLKTDGRLGPNAGKIQIQEVLPSQFSSYIGGMEYLIRQTVERQKYIDVPNYLKPFIEEHLAGWIKSASMAFSMKERHDYVVDIDRSGTRAERDPNVIIIDRDTGTDQASSQWDEALHQFLQLKHGCKLSLQSLKAVFISNVAYFKKYRKMYGLTGTLGSQREREMLKQVHDVDFVTVPTAKSKHFHEDKPILCKSKEEWILKICESTVELTVKDRAVLIVCDTVEDVEVLYRAFLKNLPNCKEKVYSYTRDYEEIDVVKSGKKLHGGEIIIATNLAGRGTDLKITKELNQRGGLHVCLAYLPTNSRIEQQAFGRAARKGEQGSGQLIVVSSVGFEYGGLKMLDLKKERDKDELRRLSEIKTYYDTQILTEERWFSKFTDERDRLKKELEAAKVKEEVRETLLQSCLDTWAFWLDVHSKQVKITRDKSEHKLDSVFNQFVNQLRGFKSDKDSWSTWVSGNPMQMVKLGKCLCNCDEFDLAIKLFNSVIEQEPQFSEAAHYYKAFALGKKIGWEFPNEKDKQMMKELKKELRLAQNLLERHSDVLMNASGIIDKIKKREGNSILEIDAYEKQKERQSDLYRVYSESIDDILGHVVSSQSFVTTSVKEPVAEAMYRKLLDKNILRKPRVTNTISEETLKELNRDYGIPNDELGLFLNGLRGKEFDENTFRKKLKFSIQLPSRSDFWKVLVQQGVVQNQVKYVIVKKDTLEKVDSVLHTAIIGKVNREVLEEKALEFRDSSKTFLNPELVTMQQEGTIILRKSDLKSAIGLDQYAYLKEKAVLMFNKTGNIVREKIPVVEFLNYDSIAVKDLMTGGIPGTEAEKVFAQLIEKKILVRKTEGIYKLGISFDEFDQVQLPSCPVYESVVKTLLSVRFLYRIALEKLIKQLDEKEPVNIKLMTKPHQMLTSDLVGKKVITLAKVEYIKDTETLIQEMAVDVLNKLSDKKGEEYDIAEKFSKALNISKHAEGVVKEVVIGVLKSPEKRKEESQLAESIGESLKKLYGLLQTVETPAFKLSSLADYFENGNFSNVEEMNIFALNGLDLLIKVEEKKYTFWMIFNTIVVILMGIIQIVIGVVIEVFSVGLMTHVGSAFIGEGIGDLMFAASALYSGYFSWKDYGKQKLESLIFTVATAGIGALFSKGAKISRFGLKIAGPALESGGKKVAQMAGKKLIQEVGKKAVAKAAIKRILLKGTEGIVTGAVSVGIDALLENQLRGLCESIASEILNIEGKLEWENISKQLAEAYDVLGEEKAREMMMALEKDFFDQQKFADEFTKVAFQIAGSVTKGLGEAAKKIGKSGGKFGAPISLISSAVTWSERGIHVARLLAISDQFLTDLDKGITERLEIEKKAQGQNRTNQKAEVAGDTWENAQKQVIERWKSMLHERAHSIVQNSIIGPILKDGANKLTNSVGKGIKRAYQSSRNKIHFNRFEKLKQKYLKESEKIGNELERESSGVVNPVTEQYHKNLVKLLAKTKNPKLFAALVKENIPMDLTCVNACAQVMHTVLAEKGIQIPGLTIVVEGEGNLRQEFSSVDGEKGLIVHLKLKDNHFQMMGQGDDGVGVRSNDEEKSLNNCLFDAVSDALTKEQQMLLNVSGKDLRNRVSNRILLDPELQHVIRQGWHEHAISKGAYGGAKERKPEVQTPGKNENQSADLNDPYQAGNWKFDPKKDVDLRQEGGAQIPNREKLLPQDMNAQLTAGWNKALEKANEFLDKNSKNKVRVEIADFSATIYDEVVVTGPMGVEGKALYPVQLDAILTVGNKAKYHVRLDLDNPHEKDIEGPLGPHIGYQVKIVENERKDKITGHVLINEAKDYVIPDRHRSTITPDAPLPNVIPETRVFFGPLNPRAAIKRYADKDDKGGYKAYDKDGNNDSKGGKVNLKYPSGNF